MHVPEAAIAAFGPQPGLPGIAGESSMANKSFHRTDRVEAELRRALGTLVREAVAEHGLPSVSVSDVEVSRDLAHAKVYVTALLSERSAEALAGLKANAGEIRYRLARTVKLRHVPELHFHYDDSMDRGERIDALLKAEADEAAAAGRGTDDEA